MRVYAYTRVSTAGQRDSGISPEAQEEMIRSWCKVKGYPEPIIKSDLGISGFKMKNRPALQEVLSVLEKGDVLIVYSLSRFSRSVKECMAGLDELAKRGVEFVSLSEALDGTTAAGKACIGVIAVFAQFFRDQISENTKAALRHKKENGQKLGGLVPYGFSSMDGQLTLNDDEQKTISQICELKEAGLSLRQICGWLNGSGVPTRTGAPWCANTIRKLIKRGER